MLWQGREIRWDRGVWRWRDAAGRFVPLRAPLEITLIDESDEAFNADMAELIATVLEHHPTIDGDVVERLMRDDQRLMREHLKRALFSEAVS